MATRQTKTKASYVPEIPLVVIFGHSVESAGKIEAVLRAHAIPAIAARMGTIDKLPTQIAGITKAHPSFRLIVLELEGFEDPAQPIAVAKGYKLPIIALAPLRKNKGSRRIDFAELGVVGFQSQHVDCLQHMAVMARKILDVKVPVDEVAAKKFEFVGELSVGDTADTDQDDSEPTLPPIPTQVGNTPPRQVRAIPVPTVPPQEHNLPSLPKAGVAPRATPIPPVAKPLAKNPPEFKLEGEDAMATTPRDVSAIAKNLETVLSDLCRAAADARACLNEIEAIATMLYEGGRQLLQEIRGPRGVRGVRKATIPKSFKKIITTPVVGKQRLQ